MATLDEILKLDSMSQTSHLKKSIVTRLIGVWSPSLVSLLADAAPGFITKLVFFFLIRLEM